MIDPISDFIIQIKNGYMAFKKKIILSHSNQKEALAKVLFDEGYVGKVQVDDKDKSKKSLVVELLYENKKPKLTNIVRVSTQGKRVYASKDKIGKVLGGMGCIIVSTPMGMMSDKQARKKKMGGEVICKLW